MEETVERYRKPTRILHWIHAGAFLLLVVTGIILFIPALTPALTQGSSLTRVLHRLGAVVFILIPLFYLLTNWKATWAAVKEAFTWGAEDFGWVAAAPRYYFLGDEGSMPPQDHMNTGQKLYWLTTLLTGVLFVITGGLMWFFKNSVPQGVFQWSVFVHDVAFIVLLNMFFLHLYLSVIHPLMAGIFWSMVTGKVPVKYARSHHAKWYARISKVKRA